MQVIPIRAPPLAQLTSAWTRRLVADVNVMIILASLEFSERIAKLRKSSGGPWDYAGLRTSVHLATR